MDDMEFNFSSEMVESMSDEGGRERTDKERRPM